MRTKRSVAIIMLLVALFAALILCFLSLAPARALASEADVPGIAADGQENQDVPETGDGSETPEEPETGDGSETPEEPETPGEDPDEGSETPGEEPEEPGDEPAPPAAQGVVRVTKDGTSTEYPTLSAALSAWTAGTTLTLLQDVSSATLEVSVSCTLDLNGFTLQGTSGRTLRVTGALTVTDTSRTSGGEIAGGGVRVERGGSLLLAGGYLTDNRAEEGGGVFVNDGGSFTMTGGTVTGNSATGNGGGVCLLGGASFTMTGGRIAENTASGSGGGVYAAGGVSLSGGATISGNTAGGETGNLYLASGQSITANSLSGQVGVSMPQSGTFATGSASGFFSDIPAYETEEANGVFLLVLTPLARVTASYSSAENVYPTTELEALRAGLTVTGINENGTEYLASALTYELTLPSGVEALTVGSCEIVVTATGEGGERAETSFFVNVVAPTLQSFEVAFEQTVTVYFDSDIDLLAPDLKVTGQFSDGITRPLGRTAEETQALSGDDYITSYYELSGDLSAHVAGTVNLIVRAGSRVTLVKVTVSRHVIDTASIPVTDATAVEQAGDWQVDPYLFTPELPAGVEPEVTVLGAEGNGNLAAGTYEVEIAFRVTDENNYELTGGPLSATLTVYYSSLTVTNEDGSVRFTVEREGGIPLSWELTIEDVTDEVSQPKLDGSMESRQIFAISLRDGGRIITELDTPITVRIAIDGFFANKEISLYRLVSDGQHIAVESTREGDYLTFTTTSVQTQYAVAYDAGFGLYLALTIVFGVLCVGGAGLLFWYFKHKKKLDMTLPKNEE